jgi:lipoic acid synthetase
MLPEWLAIKPATTAKYGRIKDTVAALGMRTVCIDAHCPNMAECWSSGTATFMVLGRTCTRGCRFCAVEKSAKGESIDALEPVKLAGAIKEWKLNYVVITSVCRDDLHDQGASHFAACIKEIKRVNPKILVELLIPDFNGDAECLQTIIDAHPDVIGHNLETVERISPTIRDRRASYAQSLEVLKRVKERNKKIYTKSAMMLGLGETKEEVIRTLNDLRSVGVDFMALGQYLRPTKRHVEVSEYIMPEAFERMKKKALDIGFLYVAAGPFVRSSYKAGEYFSRLKK